MDSDTIFCILEHLSRFGDILSCTVINKQFNKASKNELIWKRLSEIHYLGKIDNNYYENFKSRYKLNRFLQKHDRTGVVVTFGSECEMVKISTARNRVID